MPKRHFSRRQKTDPDRRTAGVGKSYAERNGHGFEASDNNEPHIALNNIRERLDMMCGGALAISAREGGKTTVEVTVPLTQTE